MKPWHLTTAVSLLLVAVLAGAYFVTSSKRVPEEFSEARIKGSDIAEEILAQQAFSLKTLEEIARYDKENNATEALILIANELIKNREANNKAIKLSSQLEKMATNLGEIRPSKARESATTAVASEVTLVSRLLSYNNYLSQLFEVLKLKFQSPQKYQSVQVKDLINKINDEVRAINELDKRFNESLANFDAIVLPQE